MEDIREACKLIAKHYDGRRGQFAYEAFEYINAAYFNNDLPWPLIVWAITPHGGCLGNTMSRTDAPPIITMHPSTLGGTEKRNPWGVDPALLGTTYAFDVIIHECLHVSQHYILDGQRGPTSHNCLNWVSEVNRIAPLLGLEGVEAGTTKAKRLPIEGEFTKTGKPATKVKKVTAGNMLHIEIATFPYSVRDPDFYRANELAW